MFYSERFFVTSRFVVDPGGVRECEPLDFFEHSDAGNAHLFGIAFAHFGL